VAKPVLPDALWVVIQPLLPAERPKPKGGRPRVPDRAALTGILFVLKTGIAWEDLPQELGGGCGVPCRRRLRDWQAAGVWDALHRHLLDQLGAAGQLDWSRASLDSASVPAKRGPADRAQSDRPRSAGHQTPPGGRPPGHPARRPLDRSQPPRLRARRRSA